MKTLLLLFGLILSSSLCFAQAADTTDYTQRIHANLHRAGKFGLSERSYTAGDSARIDSLARGLNKLKATSVDQAAYNTLSSAVSNRVLNSDFNTYKQNVSLAESSQNQAIAAKANAVDVYPKSQTYSQTETDVKKPDFEITGTFVDAQAKAQPGKPKVFILTNDTPFGGSSVLIWSGSSFTVIPGIPRNN